MLTNQRLLITTAEAAEILGVEITTVQRRARRGILPAQKMPGRTGAYVFDRAAIEAIASEQLDAIVAERSGGGQFAEAS